jgi:hypothetical protein
MAARRLRLVRHALPGHMAPMKVVHPCPCALPVLPALSAIPVPIRKSAPCANLGRTTPTRGVHHLRLARHVLLVHITLMRAAHHLRLVLLVRLELLKPAMHHRNAPRVLQACFAMHRGSLSHLVTAGQALIPSGARGPPHARRVLSACFAMVLASQSRLGVAMQARTIRCLAQCRAMLALRAEWGSFKTAAAKLSACRAWLARTAM